MSRQVRGEVVQRREAIRMRTSVKRYFPFRSRTHTVVEARCTLSLYLQAFPNWRLSPKECKMQNENT